MCKERGRGSAAVASAVRNTGGVGWFATRKHKAEQRREADALQVAAYEHLAGFVSSRRGVEAWIERATNFNKTTICLVAADGESTRRSIPDVEYGQAFAEEQDIPCYDAGVVPYPQRMREYGKAHRTRK